MDKPASHDKFDLVLAVRKWKTPMLVVHGDLDFRITTAQGLGTFTALQRQGIESELLFLRDENDWVLKPADPVLWHHTVIDWLDGHLKAPKQACANALMGQTRGSVP